MYETFLFIYEYNIITKLIHCFIYTRLPRELKGVIYCQAIKYGGAEEWDFLWKRYENSNVASEKARLLSALGCSTETWLLNRSVLTGA